MKLLSKVLGIAICLFHFNTQAQLTTLTVIGDDSATKNYQVIIGMVKNPSKINQYIVPNEINAPESAHDNLLQLGEYDVKEVYKYSRIAIRVWSDNDSDLVKLGDVGLSSLKLKVGTAAPIDIPISANDLLIHDKYIDISALLDQGKTFNHNEDVSIEVDFNVQDDQRVVVPGFTGKYKSPHGVYQSFNSETGGFWMPTLLFSSNLRADSTGVPFAAMPVGGAWGYKWRTKKSYFGLSIMGNWLIHTDSGESTDPTSSNNFSLTNISAGILFDINDVVSIGYSHGWDLRQGATNPGHMLVLGFGAGAIKFLKSNNGK